MPDALRPLFFDAADRLRNGWWMLAFLAIFTVTRAAYSPMSLALQGFGVGSAWLRPVGFLLALLATWICVQVREEPLASAGFDFRARWWRELALGVVIGVSAIAAIVALMAACGGVRLELDAGRAWTSMVYGAYLFLFVSLFEETLCRGFLFQRMIDGAGFWTAQVAFGALFAAAHWGNPGMSPATRLVASIDVFVGALLLGVAWRRTRSLALPVGIHFGWNWAQGSLFGFAVSGVAVRGWFHPTLLGDSAWLNGGAFGPEASVCAIVVYAAIIVAIVLISRRTA